MAHTLTPTEEEQIKNGSLKADLGKVDHTMIYWPMLERISRTCEYGEKKYSRDSWQLVENGKQRYKAALLRHLFQWLTEGDDALSSDGLPAFNQVLWNMMALSYFVDEEEKQNNAD